MLEYGDSGQDFNFYSNKHLKKLMLCIGDCLFLIQFSSTLNIIHFVIYKCFKRDSRIRSEKCSRFFLRYNNKVRDSVCSRYYCSDREDSGNGCSGGVAVARSLVGSRKTNVKEVTVEQAAVLQSRIGAYVALSWANEHRAVIGLMNQVVDPSYAYTRNDINKAIKIRIE